MRHRGVHQAGWALGWNTVDISLFTLFLTKGSIFIILLILPPFFPPHTTILVFCPHPCLCPSLWFFVPDSEFLSLSLSRFFCVFGTSLGVTFSLGVSLCVCVCLSVCVSVSDSLFCVLSAHFLLRSSSSDTGSRSSEPLPPPPPPHVELRRVGAVKAAGGASGSRAKRISQLFRGSGAGGAGGPGTPGGAQRWASEKKLPELAAGVAPEPPLPTRAAVPPGVLKIFAAGLASGANYKSVLATERSTARELVAEALERYGLTGGRGAGDSGCVDAYALCDALGRPAAGVGGGEWRAEHLRVLADAERPLLVQDLWRARPGWARRFELRGREEARRLEQEAFGAADADGQPGKGIETWGGT